MKLLMFKSKGKVISNFDFDARTGHEEELVAFSKCLENKNDVTTCAINSHDRPFRNFKYLLKTPLLRVEEEPCRYMHFV